MTISVSVVLFLGIALAVVLKLRSATVGGAVIAALFGFYLASTDAAPAVHDAVASLATAIADMGT
ncbi:hypothetical protein LHJ74_04505 [Streptomyces sp. N2-109]|uniref:Transporter n=1 Tax=Streptomyces gossypii TaxID=2883101 RepID=A0ABT2JMV2_9ACTN|nr:hypothetical protein [Streptomyces gossypii]MCT2589200.1 hypothetical protein [Streptomyces gossypii]